MKTKAVRYLISLGVLVLGWWIAPSLSADDSGGFLPATRERKLKFPEDFGSHENFQTEWWYYTGQLVTGQNELFRDRADFAFQLTFFRHSAKHGESSPWAQGYLAHAALLDLGAGKFVHEKRAASGGLAVAGASAGTLNVWNQSWSARAFADSERLSFDLKDGRRVRLTGKILPSPVLHGEGGFSRKGDCVGCASHYFSEPGIMLNGFIEGSGKQTSVRGLAWMDHEFMSNALQADQEGWDWFGLMFADGGNLMLYVLRKKGGGISFASGTLQRKNEQRALSLSDFSIETLDFWKSEKSGASYPSRWRIRVPSAGIDETLSPLFADQEISSPGEEGFTYWEGAVESATRSVIGYAEMTGYAGSLNQKL